MTTRKPFARRAISVIASSLHSPAVWWYMRKKLTTHAEDRLVQFLLTAALCTSGADPGFFYDSRPLGEPSTCKKNCLPAAKTGERNVGGTQGANTG